MGAISRQQRRAKVRQIAKSGEVDKVLDRVAANAELGIKLAIKKWEVEELPTIKSRIRGKTLLYTMAMLRIKYGYGKKRMTDFLNNMLEFDYDMAFDDVPVDDIVDMLNSELGIDTKAMIDRAVRKANNDLHDRQINMTR